MKSNNTFLAILSVWYEESLLNLTFAMKSKQKIRNAEKGKLTLGLAGPTQVVDFSFLRAQLLT